MNEKLLAFYFGNLNDEDRTQVEDLLISSPSHLMEFISIKRTFEMSGEGPLAPSEGLKRRLRNDVYLLFREKRRWVPALAAAAALLVAGGIYLKRSHESRLLDASSGKTSIEGMVDSSSSVAESLNIL